ncbi:MAG: Rpn family recombination-promoting nuclease/putative transposase [Planctomycetaceae bacterium]|nr:Rpn family recombination-promoting nuclease/putative transposase [Planctomycetaceae bacterium]
MAKYINPYTDFGFKKLFGEEANKDLLIDFLNTLLPKKHQIKTLSFKNPELLGAAECDRRAVFDVYCKAKNGEQFIVEMQKGEQAYFKDRSVYYTTHPIRSQGQKGKWNFELKAVYFIGILDFVYDNHGASPILIREVSHKDQLGEEFYEKLQMIYIQMPVFDKKESELQTRQDKWLYFLKNLPSLEQIPAIMKEKVFQKAFHTAEVISMTEQDRLYYEQNLLDYWTYLATIETAENKGIEIGIEKGIVQGRAEGEAQKAIDIARAMKKDGVDTKGIAKFTGLSPEEIKRLE